MLVWFSGCGVVVLFGVLRLLLWTCVQQLVESSGLWRKVLHLLECLLLVALESGRSHARQAEEYAGGGIERAVPPAIAQQLDVLRDCWLQPLLQQCHAGLSQGLLRIFGQVLHRLRGEATALHQPGEREDDPQQTQQESVIMHNGLAGHPQQGNESCTLSERYIAFISK